MRAIRLQTEYLTDPIGIGASRPILMWNCEGGVKQTAYRIVTEKWDSGKVCSSSMRAEYPATLQERERVTWRVCLWDENDTAGEWSEAFFETGISSWQAQWITGNYKVNRQERYPADCFRRTFRCERIAKARLYITACGVYEARLNGEKAGSFVLAPGITDYRKRIQYQAYDVTGLLRPGENTLTVQLADGWYRGSTGAWGLRNQYGTETKLLAQLELTAENGSVTVIGTDDSWKWSNDGPIRFADNKDGEVYCASDEPSYSGRAKSAKCSVVPSPSNNVPLTEHERFSAVKRTTPSGKTVLDFGQNIAGYLTFAFEAKAGQRLLLRFGELLDADGEFTQKNIQVSNKKLTTPLQQVVYTCREGYNEYKTTFAIFGFQYVLAEGDLDIDPDCFTAIAVYSDLEETTRFDSSSELLNRFYRGTLWSAKNNSADLPTDCPTRERHGWSGDAQIFCGTASYLFSYLPFGRKYENDLLDTQHRNGKIGQIAPSGGVDFYMSPMDGSAGWSDAAVLIPARLYEQYRDLRILQDFYPAMKRYADYKLGTVGKWYPSAVPTGVGPKYAGCICNYGQSYGEWAEPADVKPFSVSDFVSPHPEETTAYAAYLMDKMTDIAGRLNKPQDAEKYRAAAEKLRTGYRQLVKTKKNTLDTDRQAKLVRPLFMKLLDEEQTAYAEKRLLTALDRYGWRLGTGFLSTPLILDVLADIGIDHAYRLLENEEIPGWLSMPKNGATTVWEAWEGPNSSSGGIGSLDHYSKGAVMEWVFRTMCGIRVTGENRFAVAPRPGGHFTHASLTYRSAFGEISSAWKKENGSVTYAVTVPANCTAEVTLGTETFPLTAGSYTFTREQ